VKFTKTGAPQTASKEHFNFMNKDLHHVSNIAIANTDWLWLVQSEYMTTFVILHPTYIKATVENMVQYMKCGTATNNGTVYEIWHSYETWCSIWNVA
jgi:hypothetical protein